MNTLAPLLDFYRSHGGASAWTQNADARDDIGRPADGITDGITREPVAWCPLGAARVVAGEFDEVFALYYDELRRRVGGQPDIWNDVPGRTWPEVEEMLAMPDVPGLSVLAAARAGEPHWLRLARQAAQDVYALRLRRPDRSGGLAR